jgi:putative transposase
MSELPLTIHSRNGKIERWHKSLKSECIRPGTPLLLEDAPRLVEGYVEHYNNVRLHSAIGYVTPKDMLAGRQQEIQAERDPGSWTRRGNSGTIAASGRRDR